MIRRKITGVPVNRTMKQVNSYGNGHETPLQDKICDYLKKNPNATRKDLYKIHHDEGHVRTAIRTMLGSGRIKETFTILN